jgi:hypothetical protein
MRLSLALTSVALLFLFSACSGVQQTEGQPRDTEESRSMEEQRVSLSSFETFDPSTYAVQQPQPRVDVQHTVPDRLMRGEASRGVRRVVEGFRIQIFSTREKSAAERRRTEARSWWEQVRQNEEVPEDLFPEQLPTDVAYRQPYYRVRVGSFAERSRAEQALALVRQKYPDAFISRGRVTITR